MRIGIDAHILGKNQGGVERYVREVVRRVPVLLPDHHFFIFVNQRYARTVSGAGNVNYVVTPVSDPIIQRSLILPLQVRNLRLDLLHTQRVLPFFVNCRCLVSMHDILPVSAPDNHRGYRNHLVRRLTPWSARKAVTVLTVSRTVKKEIVETLGVPEKKVKVIYNGLNHHGNGGAGQEGNPTGDMRPPYILYAGAIERRKNLLRLVKAFRLIHEKRAVGLKLVIAGMDREVQYKKELGALIQREGLAGSVIFTGYVTDETLDTLYRQADLFVAPSLGEGFDLPPLEAMRRGTPVICSDIAVHRELLDGAALFFDPAAYSQLAESALLIYSQPGKKENLVASGKARADQFTWEKTAWQTAEAYQEAGQRKI